MTKYNGWTNWDTWNAYNWISSYEFSWEACKEFAKNKDFRFQVELSGSINHDGIDPNKVNWTELQEALLEE